MLSIGTVHVRRAEIGDAAGIARVHAVGWRKVHLDLVPVEDLHAADVTTREAFWRDELSLGAHDREPWVALVDDQVVGFSSAGPSRDDDAGPTTGEVYLAYVDPDFWGRGIGQTLVTHALRDLRKRGYDVATFWIVAENAHARHFAEQHGWTADGSSRYETCGNTQVEQTRYQHPLA